MNKLAYSPLHVHTTFSALDGAAKPRDLAARCVEIGHAACAITDHGTVLGHFDFWHEMKKAGVRPLLGVEAYHVEDVAAYANPRETEGERRQGERRAMEFAHLTILARTQEGYGNLLGLVTESYRHFYRKPLVDDRLLFRYQQGLTILSGCVIGRLSQLINAEREEEALALMERYASTLERFYVELVPCKGLDLSEKALPVLYRMAKKLGLPMVATDDSHFCRPEEFIVQDTLLCANVGDKVFASERKIQLPDIHYRCSGEEVLDRLKACLPGVSEGELVEIVERSAAIAAECEDVELPRAGAPVFAVPAEMTVDSLLRKLAWEGLEKKLKRCAIDVSRTLETSFGKCSFESQETLTSVIRSAHQPDAGSGLDGSTPRATVASSETVAPNSCIGSSTSGSEGRSEQNVLTTSAEIGAAAIPRTSIQRQNGRTSFEEKDPEQKTRASLTACEGILSKETTSLSRRTESVTAGSASTRASSITTTDAENRCELNVQNVYEARLERELEVVCSKNFAHYFLIVADLVSEMRRRDILVVPRGSAGGSLLLWALGVTVVDPIKHDLPFERFLDEGRPDPPDCDLDFQHDRRHEAFDYLEQKYGAENCAHVCNVVTFGARQALLDGGKALEIPDWALGAMARLVPEGEDADAGLHDAEVLSRLFATNETAKKVLAKCPALAVVAALEGHVRNMSVHAGGFLVSAVPIETFTAVMQRPIRDKGRIVGYGERVASLTKDQAAALGALKLDVLGSKTLTAIKETLDQCGLSLDWLYSLPIEDAGVFEMLGRGQNLGIFQLQGTAAGRIMRRLQPATFDEFVAVSALARPGPLQSGSVDHFIDRKHGAEAMPDLHPELARILGPTRGIVVYQEQAMALAKLAGFPDPEVQKIRKLVSKIGGADAIEAYKERLCLGWFAAGVPVEQIIEVWGQVKKAANYLFCAAHAVQYGYVGMWTGHLKRLAPEVFTAALCRNVGGNDPDDRLFALLREFAERGGEVVLLDRICSRASFHGETGRNRVIGGFGSLKGVGPKTAPKVAARAPFVTWDNLYAALGKRVGQPLAASGLARGELDSDVLQSLAPWFPMRPLSPEERALRDRYAVPIARIQEAVGRGWSGDVWVVGRVAQRVAIDLVAQAKKYGSEPPAPGDPTTKLRMTIADETGALDLGFSAKVWAAHARAGLLAGPGAGLGNTLLVKAWWSAEWERFFVREARLLRVWRPFAVPRSGDRADHDGVDD